MASPLMPRRALVLLCPVAALALSACGTNVSTSAFKGEEHAVAQTLANLQTHATANEQGKICGSDLSAKVVEELKGKSGCEAAIKTQLGEIENLELSVQSISIAADKKTATAHVRSRFRNKEKTSTLALVKEGSSWKVSGL
jgi:copper chaperone CopZ